MTSKTKAALAIYDRLKMLDPDKKNAVSAAAQEAGIATATLSLALKRRDGSSAKKYSGEATQKALAIYAQQETKSVKLAAAEAGISASTLSLALKRREEQKAAGREHCPCCGQVVREGFEIDQSVLR